MRKRLSNFFSEPSNLINFISCVIGIILTIIGIYTTETFIPPNEKDYEELHDVEEQVKDDFNFVYSIPNSNIEIKEDLSILVTLVSTKNSEYELEMNFNKEKEWIKSEEVCSKLGFDKPNHPIIQKIELCVATALLAILFSFIIYIYLWIVFKIFSILIWICKKIKTKLEKKKQESKCSNSEEKEE